MDAHSLALVLCLFTLAGVRIALTLRRRRLRPKILARTNLGSDQVIVQDVGGCREMVVVGRETMVWTRMVRRSEDGSAITAPPIRSGFGYVDAQVAAAPTAPSRILLVGCGGGIAASMLAARGHHVTVVELHPAVVDLARAYFDLPATVVVHVAEAAAFVASTTERWDLVILDAYGAMVMPKAMVSRDFYRSLARRTRRVTVNVAGDPSPVASAMLALYDGSSNEPCEARTSLLDVQHVPGSSNVVLTTTRDVVPLPFDEGHVMGTSHCDHAATHTEEAGIPRTAEDDVTPPTSFFSPTMTARALLARSPRVCSGRLASLPTARRSALAGCRARPGEGRSPPLVLRSACRFELGVDGE